MSNPSNMKQLVAYAQESRRQRAKAHRDKVLRESGGERVTCRPFTDKEYRKIVVSGKTSYSKARKFTHNKMWRDTHKKFEVEQLKYIKR